MKHNKGIIHPIALLLVLITVTSCSSIQRSIEHKKRVNLGQSIYEEIINSEIQWTSLGRSVEGREILLMDMGEGDSTTLIFGGIHGSELSGAQLSSQFAEYVFSEMQGKLDCRLILIPVLNPDGLLQASRRNANGVDVNRNFPTENWSTKHRSAGNFPGDRPASEPETRILMDLLDSQPFVRIVSIHAPLEMVNYDGPAKELAERMAVHNSYPVSSDIGYPTPGSFGTYAGIERRIPTITLELPRGAYTEEIWLTNRDALLETLKY